MIEKILNELEILLVANPEVEIRDGAKIINVGAPDKNLRHKTIKDCLNLVKKVISDDI